MGARIVRNLIFSLSFLGISLLASLGATSPLTDFNMNVKWTDFSSGNLGQNSLSELTLKVSVCPAQYFVSEDSAAVPLQRCMNLKSDVSTVSLHNDVNVTVSQFYKAALDKDISFDEAVLALTLWKNSNSSSPQLMGRTDIQPFNLNASDLDNQRSSDANVTYVHDTKSTAVAKVQTTVSMTAVDPEFQDMAPPARIFLPQSAGQVTETDPSQVKISDELWTLILYYQNPLDPAWALLPSTDLRSIPKEKILASRKNLLTTLDPDESLRPFQTNYGALINKALARVDTNLRNNPSNSEKWKKFEDQITQSKMNLALAELLSIETRDNSNDAPFLP